MTYLVKDIADHLLGDADIVDAFGEHFYTHTIPQSVVWEQAILINDLTNEPEYDLSGEVGTHTSMIQIDVWTDGKGQRPRERVNTLAELIRNRLSGYKGQFGTGVWGSARLRRNNTVAAPPLDGSDVHRRRASMDFEIIHSADVPTLT